MSQHTILNLKTDVPNPAPQHGMGDIVASHFARVPLGLTRSGLSLFVVAPRARLPFGHTHAEQEEVYVVVSGSARMKVDDAIVEMQPWDALPEALGSFTSRPVG